jgi:hypothetical protein
MTLQDHLALLVRFCEAGQKEAAWYEAKLLAQIDPYQLSELPSELTATMKARQALNTAPTGGGGKSDPLRTQGR